jgi:hypothetical protein
MADECEKKRDRITQSDMQHREKQQRLMHTMRAEMDAAEQKSTASNTTTPISSQTTSPSMSRKMSPSPTNKISRRERVEKKKQSTKTYKRSAGACNKQEKS